MSKRKLVAFCAAILVTLAAFHAGGDEYLDNAKADYNVIFIAKILSANTVTTTDGYACFFRYKVRILKLVRGKLRSGNLSFSSELGLTIGDQYLIFFSEEAARLKRFGSDTKPGTYSDRCRRLIAGPHLLYNELHHVVREWDGSRFVDLVDLNDARARNNTYPGIKKALQLTNLDFVERELQK